MRGPGLVMPSPARENPADRGVGCGADSALPNMPFRSRPDSHAVARRRSSVTARRVPGPSDAGRLRRQAGGAVGGLAPPRRRGLRESWGGPTRGGSSLAANVAVAEPTLIGRVIAAWPSFALTASCELLTRQVRRSSASTDSPGRRPQRSRTASALLTKPAPAAELRLVRPPELGKGSRRTPAGADLQRRAGSGRWPTLPLMEACPAAARSALPMAATNGGDAWSRTPARGRHFRIPGPGTDRPA